MFAVNPSAETVEGDPCYPDLTSIPGGVDAVVIATRPAHAAATVRQAADLGIKHVWMHRSVDARSVDEEATTYGRACGMTVIDGGCPLMFGPPSDRTHRVMCRLMTLTGPVPRTVGVPCALVQVTVRQPRGAGKAMTPSVRVPTAEVIAHRDVAIAAPPVLVRPIPRRHPQPRSCLV